MVSEKIKEEKEPEVFEIPDIPEEQVELEKVYYCCVYVMLRFKNEVGVYSKEEKADVEDDPDKEDMDDVNLENARGNHWRMVCEENYVGVDDKKVLLYSKRWDLYVHLKVKAYSGWVFGGSCQF